MFHARSISLGIELLEVSFRMQDREEDWILVEWKKSKSSYQGSSTVSHRQHGGSDSGSDHELKKALTTRKTTYRVKDNVPGLSVRRSKYLSNQVQ